MDAKNIYIAIRHVVSIAHWVSFDNNQWSYIGEKKDFNLDLAQNRVEDFFDGSRLYLSVDRHTGEEISKDEAAKNVHDHLEHSVFLADEDFKKVMEFSHIGVFRCGYVAR